MRTEKENIPFEMVKGLVVCALEDFYRNDAILMDYINEREAVSERCMVFRIGCYMLERMKVIPAFQQFQLDCEYNRNLENPKLISIPCREQDELGMRMAYPDLIIHKRRRNDDNLLVIEFKKGKAAKNAIDLDINKLKGFTMEMGEYGYRFGFFITLYKEYAQIKVYQNGSEIEKWAFDTNRNFPPEWFETGELL